MFSRTVRKGSLQFGSLVVALGLVPAIASAQFHPKDTEWFSYAADVAGTRYRPLDPISATSKLPGASKRTISETGRSTSSRERR